MSKAQLIAKDVDVSFRGRSTLNNEDPFDTVIEGLLVSLLTFMPLAFGVVHAWSEEIVIALSGAVIICFLLKLTCHRGHGLIWTWSYVPIGLFLLIVVIQLVGLPASLVNIISPNTVIIRKELLGDLPYADTLLKSVTLSFYPNATKHDLRLILAVVAVFFVVLNVFRRPAQIRRLLIAIVLIGGFIAMITLAQNLFGNGKIYWFISTQNSKGYSGSFVNHNNYGQFMNLSIGAAIGLLMMKLKEAFAGRKITPPAVFDYLSSNSARLLWLLVVMIGVAVATIFISLTRGGMISTLIAMAFITVIITSQRSLKGHGWIMVFIALIAFTCVLYIGFDAVYDRLMTLRDFNKAEGGRLQILKDIMALCTKFPFVGTGLGTHSVVYPMFDNSTITKLAAHAENEYAQVVEETGVTGLGLLIAFGAIIWLHFFRTIRNTNLSICSAAYGLGFGLMAILIHSLSDFGQHLPSNSFLSAIFCALILSLSMQAGEQNQTAKTVTSFDNFKGPKKGYFTIFRKIKVPLVTLLGVSVIWIWSLIGANNFRVAQSYWQKVCNLEKTLADKKWQGTDEEYARLISYAATAAQYVPENVKYRHWLNVYRWRSISQITDHDTGITIVPEDSMPLVHEIVADLHKTRTICSTYGPTYSVVGQIEKFVLNDDSGAERIRKGFYLAPCDPVACFVAGYLDVSEGKTEDCVIKFEKAIQLESRLFRDVAKIYVYHLSCPELAISAAGNNVGWLAYTADILEEMRYADLAKQTRERIKNLLEERCSRHDAPASAFISLANIYKRNRNNKAAIECYRSALVLDYAQIQWRFELAKLLANTGKMSEAMREAKICLRLSPEFGKAKKLVADFSVHPSILAKETELP